MFEACLMLHANPNRPIGRTLRLYPAITRLAVCTSKPLRQQIPCRLIVVPMPALCSPHVCHAGQIERSSGARSYGRCARCMQTGCKKGDKQTIFPSAETVHLTSVCMRFLRAPIAHRSVGQWPPNRPRARRKQGLISDVDDNRTALIAPSTARFTDLGIGFTSKLHSIRTQIRNRAMPIDR
jgi:hypothetical protein